MPPETAGQAGRQAGRQQRTDTPPPRIGNLKIHKSVMLKVATASSSMATFDFPTTFACLSAKKYNLT